MIQRFFTFASVCSMVAGGVLAYRSQYLMSFEFFVGGFQCAFFTIVLDLRERVGKLEARNRMRVRSRRNTWQT